MGGATGQSEGQLDVGEVPGVGHGVRERVIGHSRDVGGDEEVVHYIRGRMIYVDCAIQIIHSEEDLYHSLGREREGERGREREREGEREWSVQRWLAKHAGPLNVQ